MHIGMIGIGLMGHGIAANILKNDSYRLTFLTHAGNQPTNQLEAAGAMAAGSIKEVVEEADIILICVTGATQVEEVLFSPDGVGTYAGKGQIIIDCSTSMPEKTRLF